MNGTDYVAKPALTAKQVKFVLEDQFGFAPKCIKNIKELASYDDQNFCVKLKPNGRKIVLKITNWKDSENKHLIREITLMMLELAKSIPCSVPIKTTDGEVFGHYSYESAIGRKDCIVRVFEYLPGKTLQKGHLKASQAFQWGSLLARMHRAMQDLEFPLIEERNFLWSWEGVLKVRQFIGVHSDEKKRALINTALQKYETIAHAQLAMEERVIIHGDLNEQNVLVNDSGEVYAALDFGDCHGGPAVWDLAVVLAYIGSVVKDLDQDLLGHCGQALLGYYRHFPAAMYMDADVETIRIMICARLAQSLTLGLVTYEHSKDPYVLGSQNAWACLEKLLSEPRENIVNTWKKYLDPLGFVVT
ncbi:hydroxylysine kinase [Galendromus occidentalis]|uniref:Hydroxylysine kinase n=1 Tax=Galendromus occidentalis TaxID=34638 RepID=A0AAJ6VVW8_9ACAR|nr:hydroxylysine kinase [Galendromus occidentalis]